MIKLEYNIDSIFPPGLEGTAFEVVFKALQSVAAGVFSVDDAAWRSAVAWGYYLAHDLDSLAATEGGRDFLAAACVSEQVPLIKDSQTSDDLADLLRRWAVYKPTFSALEGLYIPYKATVDVLPVTDDASQAVFPSGDTKGAFYLAIRDISGENPLTIPEAVEIALKATPIGSHPLAYYGLSGEVIPQSCGCVYGDVDIVAGVDENAEEPIGPVYMPKYVRLSFGAARNDVSIAPISRSSTSLKFFYGVSTYSDIGKYLLGDGAPLNFSVAKAIKKSGEAIDASKLLVKGLSDSGTDLYLFNSGSSTVSVSTVYIEIPQYTYAVYGQGATILSKRQTLAPGAYVNLLGANPTWNYTWVPNALYRLMGAPGNLFDCEFRNEDGTYTTRSDVRIYIGENYMNITNVTSATLYNIPSCRFETWLPEMYNLVNGEMVPVGASALSLEEE